MSNLSYVEYLAENLDKNIKYSEYISDHIDKNIKYSEYISDHIDKKTDAELLREQRTEKMKKIFGVDYFTESGIRSSSGSSGADGSSGSSGSSGADGSSGSLINRLRDLVKDYFKWL